MFITLEKLSDGIDPGMRFGEPGMREGQSNKRNENIFKRSSDMMGHGNKSRSRKGPIDVENMKNHLFHIFQIYLVDK